VQFCLLAAVFPAGSRRALLRLLQVSTCAGNFSAKHCLGSAVLVKTVLDAVAACTPVSRQLLHEHFYFFHVGGFEALREPLVEWFKQFKCSSAVCLLHQQAGEAERGTQL